MQKYLLELMLNRHKPPQKNIAGYDVASLRQNILGGLKALGLNVHNIDECGPLAEEITAALANFETKHQRSIEALSCQIRAQEDMLLLVRDALQCGAEEGWQERAVQRIDEILKGVEWEETALLMFDIDDEDLCYEH